MNNNNNNNIYLTKVDTFSRTYINLFSMWPSTNRKEHVTYKCDKNDN